MGSTVPFLATALAAVSALAQSPLPPAPHGSVVTVSPQGGHYSEPGIALNPKNPRQIVAVYQGGAATQGSATAAFSVDGGSTFKIAEGTHPPDWKVAGDVSTAFDNKGNAYLCYLAFDKLGTADYWAHGAGRNGIFVLRSKDGGKIWDRRAIAVKAFQTGKEPGLQFEDEPRIFSDTSAASPYAGNLYVGWVEWQLTQSVILFSRSTDEGQTWSAPAQISTHPGLPRDDNGSLGGFAVAVGPDGALYAIWDDGNSIALTESRDGGKTFSQPRTAIEVGPPYFVEVTGVSRVEGFPQVAIDPRSGRPGGNLYICWSDYRNGDVDVFVAASHDHGRSWSQPVRVNSDPLHDGKDQFYEWMAVDPVTSALYVQFYDRQDPKGRDLQITLARSTDGGRTFTSYTWSKTPFDPGDSFLGDYTWMAAYNNHVYGAWTEAVKSPEQTGKAAPPHHRGNKTVILVGKADFSNTR
jgi:hypothetical protein